MFFLDQLRFFHNSTPYGIFKSSLILIKPALPLHNPPNQIVFRTVCSYITSLPLFNSSFYSITIKEECDRHLGGVNITIILVCVSVCESVVGVQVDLSLVLLALPVRNDKQDASCMTILITS